MHGFSLQYEGERFARDSPCLKSALENANIVREKLRKELNLGRIAGPFTTRPLQNLQCSPLGLVPKKQPGEFRLIHHLSSPEGASINDFIDEKETTLLTKVCIAFVTGYQLQSQL